MTATLTFNDDDTYLADVAERLAALGELPNLPHPMPTWGEMVAWVARGRCPRDAKSEAERRCRAPLWMDNSRSTVRLRTRGKYPRIGPRSQCATYYAQDRRSGRRKRR